MTLPSGYSWLSVIVETVFLLVVLGLAMVSRRPGKPWRRGELNGKPGIWFFKPDDSSKAEDE